MINQTIHSCRVYIAPEGIFVMIEGGKQIKILPDQIKVCTDFNRDKILSNRESITFPELMTIYDKSTLQEN